LSKFGKGGADDRCVVISYDDFSLFDLDDFEGLMGARYESSAREDQVEVVVLGGERVLMPELDDVGKP
jgi:Asp/Glu/hydantoin racemase